MHEPSTTNLPRIRRAASLARYGTCLLLLVMFLGTHLPAVMQPTFSLSDKLIHLVAYMALTVSLLASWELTTGILRPQHYFFVWLSGTVYGAFDELTQIPVGRTCDGFDWLADIAGIAVGLILFRVARPLLYRWL